MEQLICLLVVRCFDVSYRDLFINLAIPSHGVPLQDWRAEEQKKSRQASLFKYYKVSLHNGK